MLRTSESPETSAPEPLVWSSPAEAVPSRARWLVDILVGPGLPVALAVLTFIAFSSALFNDFVNWDDYVIVKDNMSYRGFGWTNLRWMFTSVLMGHWVPLTWLTLAMDHLVWGMKPFGYHLTNLLLHSASAAVFFAVARRLLDKATGWDRPALRLGAAVATLFFSLHPLRAESVAWVTERRDVLSGFLFLLTLLGYLAAVDGLGRRRRWLLGISVGAFALAFMAKSTVMMLPFVLVLLDIYPLRRLFLRRGLWRSEDFRTLCREKVPYFAVGAAGALVAYFAQAMNFFITPLARVPVSERPALVFYGLAFYVAKTAVPIGLSPLYQLPVRIDPFTRRFVIPAVFVVLAGVVLVALRRRWPAGLAVAAYYAIVIAPVVGIVHSGFQLAHDRYSYLSCMSWPLLVGAAAGWVMRARQHHAIRASVARLAAGVMIVWLGGLATLSWYQVQIWHDTEALWRYATQSEPECRLCENNLGVMLLNQGVPTQAKEHLERALVLNPDAPRTHMNLALAYAYAGDSQRAYDELTRIVQHDPGDSEARNNMGVALLGLRRYREALESFRLGLRLQPNNTLLLTNAAVALSELGDTAESVRYLRRAIEVKPDAPYPRYTLGLVALHAGDVATAREQHEALRKLDPALASLFGPALLAEW
jgi:protein O-mannosyl-transferase